MAPAFMARTEVGTSPWPVAKMSGNLPAGICQYTLELEPVYSGHPQIGHQACGDIRLGLAPETPARRETIPPVTRQAQETLAGAPERRIASTRNTTESCSSMSQIPLGSSRH